MELTASTIDWLYLMLGYGLLAVAARLGWLGLRGWHVLAKEDVPMVDVVAVILSFGLVLQCAHLEPLIGRWIDVEWRQWVALAALPLLICLTVLSGRTAIGQRWRALGTDAASLSRLGLDTVAIARNLALLALLAATLAGLLAGSAMALDLPGHWALAGVVVLLIGGRLEPVLIVVGVAVTAAHIIGQQTEMASALAISSLILLALLLLAARWRQPVANLHVD